MTHYTLIQLTCSEPDCRQMLTVEFQPANVPSIYAKYTDGERIGYATVHCGNPDCKLHDASFPADEYESMQPHEFEQWRGWVAAQKARVGGQSTGSAATA